MTHESSLQQLGEVGDRLELTVRAPLEKFDSEPGLAGHSPGSLSLPTILWYTLLRGDE